jgi:hypothetical protein
MTPPTRQWGPPRTLPKPKAKRGAAVKSSPTEPRAPRREAVPLDCRAKRSYPNHHRPHSPQRWVEKCDRSVANSETPHSKEHDSRQAAVGLQLSRWPSVEPSSGGARRGPVQSGRLPRHEMTFAMPRPLENWNLLEEPWVVSPAW